MAKENPYITRYAKKQRGAFGKATEFGAPAGMPTADPASLPQTSSPGPAQFNPAIESGNIASRVSSPDSSMGATATAGGGLGVGNAPAKGVPTMQANSNSIATSLTDPTKRFGTLDAIDQIGNDSLSNMQQQVAQMRARRARSSGGGGTDPFGGIVNSQFIGSGNGEGGFDLSGAPIDDEQRKNALKIMQIGKSRGMNDADIEIAIMTSLTETGLRNLNYGDRDSVGLFQQRTSQGWGTVQQIMDPNYSINKFFDEYGKLARNRKDLTPWQKAQAVQRSFDPQGNNFRAQYGLAQKIMAGSRAKPVTAGGTGRPTAAAGFIQQYNNKYLDFDGQFGAQCVDLFNYYNKGFVGGGFIGGVYGAKDIWSNRQMDQNYQRMNRSARPNMGDVVVWDGSIGGGFGHVAIVVGYNSNGTIRVLHSNATPQGSRGNSVISNMTRNGVLGYFRPKKLAR